MKKLSKNLRTKAALSQVRASINLSSSKFSRWNRVGCAAGCADGCAAGYAELAPSVGSSPTAGQPVGQPAAHDSAPPAVPPAAHPASVMHSFVQRDGVPTKSAKILR